MDSEKEKKGKKVDIKFIVLFTEIRKMEDKWISTKSKSMALTIADNSSSIHSYFLCFWQISLH